MALPTHSHQCPPCLESNPLSCYYNKPTATRQRRRSCGSTSRSPSRMVVVCLLATTHCYYLGSRSSSSITVDAFTPRTFGAGRQSFAPEPSSPSSSFTSSSSPNTQLLVSSMIDDPKQNGLSGRGNNGLSSNTWSRPSATASSSGTRFGVRKRVKAVLEKAKNRTGLTNRHSDASVIAEAATIGGFYDEADLVVRKRGGINGNINGNNNNGMNLNKSNGAAVDQALREVQGRSPLRNGTDVDLVLESSVAPAPARAVDVNAVLNSGKVEPLPFQLPKLTSEQLSLLASGERIQEQSKMGREGSGYVVVDVKAPDYVVWECLLDFEKYPETINTVRSMTMFTNTHLKQSYIAEQPVLPGTGRETRHYGKASITRASFILSKFKLNIAAVHKYRPHPDGHYMEFTLDKACRNMVLQDAKGIWYTESNPDGRGEEYTRVWLLCELKVSRALPSFIVDYTAKRAMPRASSWIKPTVQAMKRDFGLEEEV